MSWKWPPWGSGGPPQGRTVTQPVRDVLIRVVNFTNEGTEEFVPEGGRRVVELTVARAEAKGEADLPASEGDVRRGGRRTERSSSACQVALPQGWGPAHGTEQGGPDAGGGRQKARLALHEGGWVASASRAPIILRATPGTARFGRLAAIVVALDFPG